LWFFALALLDASEWGPSDNPTLYRSLVSVNAETYWCRFFNAAGEAAQRGALPKAAGSSACGIEG